MEIILFIGLQATGKSTFYQQRFSRTHLRINLDMLKTRFRERLLVNACFESKTKFVVENTNLRRADRATYIVPAHQAGFDVQGYYFESRVQDALARNEARSESDRVPALGILGASRRLELPSLDEGFSKLYHVRIAPAGEFIVEDWKNEV